MRLLILPMCASRAHITSESDFRVYGDLMEGAREYKIPAFGCWIMFQKLDDELQALPNEQFLCIEPFGSIYDQQINVPPGLVDLFHPLDGKYPVDAIVTSRAILAGSLKRLFWHSRHPQPQIPVFIVEPHVETSAEIGEGKHNVQTDNDLFMRSVGYASSFTFFATERQREGAFGEAARWLSAKVVDNIRRNSVVMPLSIKCDEIDAVRQSTPKREKFTAGFFGRLSTNKNWQWIMPVLRKFWMSGKPVDLVAVTPLSGAISDLSDYPEVSRFVDLPRIDYLKMLASTHVALNASHEEGFTVGLMEQLYAGLVVLLPRRPWVKALLKHCYDSYPWLYTGEAEAYTKLEMVRQDYAAAQASIEPVRQMIRQDYDVQRVVTGTFDAIRRVVEENKLAFSMSEEAVELIRKAQTNVGPIFKFSRLCDLVRQLARQPGIIFNRHAVISTFPGKLQVYWKLKELGYTDCLDGADPTFVSSQLPPHLAQRLASGEKQAAAALRVD